MFDITIEKKNANLEAALILLIALIKFKAQFWNFNTLLYQENRDYPCTHSTQTHSLKSTQLILIEKYKTWQKKKKMRTFQTHIGIYLHSSEK